MNNFRSRSRSQFRKEGSASWTSQAWETFCCANFGCHIFKCFQLFRLLAGRWSNLMNLNSNIYIYIYMFFWNSLSNLNMIAFLPKSTQQQKSYFFNFESSSDEKVTNYNSILWIRCFGTIPFPVTVTTRVITFVLGNPYKPSLATVTGVGEDPSDAQ